MWRPAPPVRQSFGAPGQGGATTPSASCSIAPSRSSSGFASAAERATTTQVRAPLVRRAVQHRPARRRTADGRKLGRVERAAPGEARQRRRRGHHDRADPRIALQRCPRHAAVESIETE